MTKRLLQPNTTLYPVPVVLITAGIEQTDVMTCNRIASCSAEPPRLCISIRPQRHTHTLIKQTGEFVVNLPAPHQHLLTDYVGVVTGRTEDKLGTSGFTLARATHVQTPLLTECPVNIECMVEQALELDSHTLFIGLVQAVHADERLLDARGEVDFALAQGIAYPAGVVREKPVYTLRVEELRQKVKQAQKGSRD